VRIHCVSPRSKDSLSVVVFCYMLMCVGCFGLVVSTCQVIGWKDPTPRGRLNVVRRLPPQSPGGRVCLCVFFFCLVCLCSYVSPPCRRQYIFHMPVTRYSLFVLKVKVKLNKQTNKLSSADSGLSVLCVLRTVFCSWSLHCMLIAAQYIVIGPVCGCVCVFVCGSVC